MASISIGLGVGAFLAVPAGNIPFTPRDTAPVLAPSVDGTVEITVRAGAVTVIVGAPDAYAGTYATTTAALAAGPVHLRAPALSGGTAPGDAVTARPGLVLHREGNPPAISRQWLRDGVPIPGAAGPSYTVAEADRGRSLALRETASNADGTRSASSAPLAIPAAPAATAPAAAAPPAIAGTARVGQTLAASAGTWTGTAPIAHAYQWQRGTADIAGATGASYTAVAADAGQTLRVVVTASNGAGSASAASAPTEAVAAAVLSVTRLLTLAQGKGNGLPNPAYTNDLDLSAAQAGDRVLVLFGPNFDAAAGSNVRATLGGETGTLALHAKFNSGGSVSSAQWVLSGPGDAATPLVVEHTAGGSTNGHAQTAYLIRNGSVAEARGGASQTGPVTLAVSPTDARNEIIGVTFGRQAVAGTADMAWTGLTHVESPRAAGASAAARSDVPVGPLTVTATPATVDRFGAAVFVVQPSA